MKTKFHALAIVSQIKKHPSIAGSALFMSFTPAVLAMLPMMDAPVDFPSSSTQAITAPTRPEKKFCDAQHPVLFKGQKHDFVLTVSETCRRLLGAFPAIGKTVEFNQKMSVTGLADGTYSFKLADDPEEIIVPRENYMAIIEAWLVSGGATQVPVPITFLFGKWRIESRLGTLTYSPKSTACGMNQFMPETLAEIFDRYGALHGYEEYKSSIRRVGAKYGVLDYGKVANDAGYRALFNQVCQNVTLSSVLGMRNSIRTAMKLQERINVGEIILPGGRTSPTARDVYIAHLLGVGQVIYELDKDGNEIKSKILERTGAIEFFYNLRHSPDALMETFVHPAAYKANNYFMREELAVLGPPAQLYEVPADAVFKLSSAASIQTFANESVSQSNSYSVQKEISIFGDTIKPQLPKRNSSFSGQEPMPSTGPSMRFPVLDEKGKPVTTTHLLSAKEFYARFETRWGFDNRAFPNMNTWSDAPYHPAGSAVFTKVAKTQEGHIKFYHPKKGIPEFIAFKTPVRASYNLNIY